MTTNKMTTNKTTTNKINMNLLNIGDGCNLDCVRKGQKAPKVHEFIGPVKIVLVDTPPSVYRYKVLMAAIMNMCYFFMGAVVMTIAFYSLSFVIIFNKVSHIFLATLGWQLIIPSAIISLNPYNGANIVATAAHSRYDHMFAMFVGMGYAVGGAVASVIDAILNKISLWDYLTVHSFSGSVATVVGIVAFVGPILSFPINSVGRCSGCIRCMNSFHIIIGVVSYLSSSVCFLTGIWRPQIRFWFPQQHMTYWLTGFCIFYTIFVCISPLMKLKNDRDKEKARELENIRITEE